MAARKKATRKKAAKRKAARKKGAKRKASRKKKAGRKKGARKTTEAHVARAKNMGRLLTRLVAHLPGEPLTDPPALREPRLDYEYLQRVARDVRQRIGVAQAAPLEFRDLIEHFKLLKSVFNSGMGDHIFFFGHSIQYISTHS